MIFTAALFSGQMAIASPSVEEQTAQILQDIEFTKSIELVKNGKGKKQVLSFHPKPGLSSTFEMRNKQTMKMKMVTPDGKEMDMSPMAEMMPTIIMPIRNRIGKPVKTGLIPIEMEYLKPRLEGGQAEMNAQILPSLAFMDGLGFRMLYDPAASKFVQVDVSAENDKMYEAIQSMADQFVNQMIDFPEEAVGVGAQWTINMDMNVSGIDMNMVQTLTVTELSKNVVSLDQSFTIDLGESGMQLPGLPPGAKVDISKFEGDGSGKMKINLESLVSTGITTVNMDMAMSVEVEGQKMQMSLDMVQVTEMRETK